MFRIIVVPNSSNSNVALDFPKGYLGEEVEIIAFKKQEVCIIGLATLIEGVGLAFDIQKCSNFQKLIMVVLKL